MKKKIGIYAASMGDSAFGVGKAYLNFISRYGSPRILTPDNLYEEDIDLLLLQGGADLNPSSYGATPNWYTGNTDVFKQHVYDNCLPNYVDAGKPILGICLGHQQLAAYFGSKITQDMPYHPTSEARGKKAHDVMPENCEFFYPDKARFDVNSFHHQGVVRRNLSDQLIVTAWADNEEFKFYKDNDYKYQMQIVESFYHVNLPIAGVQWHPEDMPSYFINSLVRHLLHPEKNETV